MRKFQFSADGLVARIRDAQLLRDGSIRAAIDFSRDDQTVWSHLTIWTDAAQREAVAEELERLTGLDRVVLSTDLATMERDLFSSESFPPMLGGKEETQLSVILSTDVPLPDPSRAEGTLGALLPEPPCLVVLAGETSAGKTVLARNIGLALAEGTPFCGLAPPRQRRVLYIDLETPEHLHREQVATIGRSARLGFVRSLPRTLDHADAMAGLRDFAIGWEADVVIFDPLALAWPVKDENDNAEAHSQMAAIKDFAVATNTASIALWNMGEGNVKEKFRARGATARLDRADLALNYTEVTETSRAIKVVKSRYGTVGMTITIRFARDLGFELVGAGDVPTHNRLAEYQARIKELVARGTNRRRGFIAFGLDDDNLLDKALSGLVRAGELRRPKRGTYELAVSSFPPSMGEEETKEHTDGLQLKANRETCPDDPVTAYAQALFGGYVMHDASAE